MSNNISERTTVTLSWRAIVAILTVFAGGLYDRWDARTDIRDIKRMVQHNTTDRWQKVDDEVYMERFANLNGLKSPVHTRVSTDTSTQRKEKHP